MNIAALATTQRRPACWDVPEAFAHPALDFDPLDEDAADLSPTDLALHTQAKADAEAAAIEVCYGCPLMMDCERLDMADMADPTTPNAYGVVGGRSETERQARQYATLHNLTIDEAMAEMAQTKPTPATPVLTQVAPGDRGPRNQVNDDLVAQMTRAGKTSDQIAHELNCSSRTVTRARRRMSNTTTATKRTAAETVTTETVATEATRTAPAPLSKGRRVSAPMSAVYDHLLTAGPCTVEELLTVAGPHIDPVEALAWWTRENSITLDGVSTLPPSKAQVPTSDRIVDGARLKARNSICAAVRKGRYLTRLDDQVQLTDEATAEWSQRHLSTSLLPTT